MTPKLQDPAEGSREVIDRELARVGQRISGEHGNDQTIGAVDVQRLLGDLDAARITDILALQPSLAELEEAAAWIAGEGDVPAREGHPLAGNAAAIFDITEAGQDHAAH